MNIAIAVDLSLESHFAIRWALDLRDRVREQDQPVKCYAICVPTPSKRFEFQTLDYPEATDDPGVHRRLAHRVRAFLESVRHDVDDVEIVIDSGEIAPVISEFCQREDIDWLVTGMSTVGPFARLFLGSTVHQLIDLAPCKLAVIHPEHPRLDGTHEFAVGIDFLPGSDAALFAAAELTQLSDARLNLVHALQDAPTGTAHGGLVNYLASTDVAHLTEDARQSLESMMANVDARYPGIEFTTLVHAGSPKQVLADFIESQNIDSLFLGKIHHPKLEKWALGSVSRWLVKRMPTTIILVPPDG